MVLAIVDDLMFASKIRSAAGQLGIPIAFARSSAAAWRRSARVRRP
jgi:hypothetical protein